MRPRVAFAAVVAALAAPAAAQAAPPLPFGHAYAPQAGVRFCPTVSARRQVMVSRGVYRLPPNQRGRIAVKLFGNGYRLAKGHRVKLELTGSDPNYLRTANGSFSVRVSKLVLHMPTTGVKPR